MKKYLVILFCAMSMYAQEAAKPVYTITTEREGVPVGSFNIELFPLIAPKAVRYFDSLVTIKFFDSLAFHRVVPGFVIQGGDPNSRNLPRETWGNGDPAQTNVPAEFSNVSYLRGILGAARDSDPNSANSQFFICTSNATSLNALYTAYGRVTTGMNICDSIVASPRDGTDNPLKKIIMFVKKIGTNDSIPAVPAIVAPANNAGRITPDSGVGWYPVSGGVLYQLDVATDSMFVNKIFSSEIGSTSNTLKNVQLGLKKYYWRVSSNNGGHRSAFTPTRSFTTAVSIPTPLFPANASGDNSGNVVLKWGKVSGAVSYHLQVSTTSNFSVAGIVIDQKGITDTVKQMSGLQLSKKHYWRVSSETPEYKGAFGVQWTFFTGTSADVHSNNELPSEFSLEQNYPNPFNPSTTIRYSIPISAASSMTTLKVFDVLGKEAATLVNSVQPAGVYEAAFDASKLVSGIYFYQLRSGNFVQTKRLTLLK
ncbi:MAG: peptidylprolyl isomerase [Bacteroidota bacterium]